MASFLDLALPWRWREGSGSGHSGGVTRPLRHTWRVEHSLRLRIYSSDDVTGVEVGAAVKNVIAIASGISDGLGFGESARAALVTRGLAEMTRLGLRLGGRPETFMGLSGVGDLILTCTGGLSRNRQVGLRLAAGQNLAAILRELGHVAEGVYSARGDEARPDRPVRCRLSPPCAACSTRTSRPSLPSTSSYRAIRSLNTGARDQGLRGTIAGRAALSALALAPSPSPWPSPLAPRPSPLAPSYAPPANPSCRQARRHPYHRALDRFKLRFPGRISRLRRCSGANPATASSGGPRVSGRT